MSKGFHKKVSKRMPAKRRYNIEKKVRAHNKKLKRDLKKKNRHKKPKDPGIPNSLPFKEQVIREAIEDKKRADEYRDMVRQQLKDTRKSEREKVVNERRNISLADISKDALKRGQQFEQQIELTRNDANDAKKQKNSSVSNLKSSYREFAKVVDASDVVIEVLDARDPMGTRCPQVEEAVIRNSANKRLILLLNKVDLIPKENLAKWLKHLRNELPTVAFKASTQSQKSNISRSRVNVLLSSDELLQSSKCLGADILMKLLGNYCRNKDIKTSITVGIVGFPNVGKSSVINSLKRSRACNVGAVAGITKTMQEVSLDKHIKLLDCPGIVFANNRHSNDDQQLASVMALRNAIKIETMDDPIVPIQAILSRIDREELMLHYRLPAFNDVNEFLSLLAKRFGKLKKGGVLDLENAARKVLTDWNIGRIKYYTIPPETQSLSSHISAEIVSSLSKEFDINDYTYDQEMQEINEKISSKINPNSAFAVKSLGFTNADIDDNDDQTEEMNLDDGSAPTLKSAICLKKKKVKASKDVEMKDEDAMSGMRLNKAKKVQFKKLKKQKKRNTKLANKLSQSFESNVSLNSDDYNFETDFVK